MGMTYGLIGTALAAPFPTNVRYTGSSITFNLAGIFGASLAPYIATWLQANYGMTYVGYYLGARRRDHAGLHPAFGQGRSLSLGLTRKSKSRRGTPPRPFLFGLSTRPLSARAERLFVVTPRNGRDLVARHEGAEALDFPFEHDAGIFEHRAGALSRRDIRDRSRWPAPY